MEKKILGYQARISEFNLSRCSFARSSKESIKMVGKRQSPGKRSKHRQLKKWEVRQLLYLLGYMLHGDAFILMKTKRPKE